MGGLRTYLEVKRVSAFVSLYYVVNIDTCRGSCSIVKRLWSQFGNIIESVNRISHDALISIRTMTFKL